MKVIIVHTNERTLGLAVRSAEAQVGKENVHLISRPSFYLSLRRAYTMAINRKWEYMILFGGDQFLLKGAIHKLKTAMDESDDDTFRISGYGWDKLLMRTRMIAPCIYRVKLLKQALKMLSANIIPEAQVLYKMEKYGYPYIILGDSLAVHDAFQYYKDIYRKGYAEARKFLEWIREENVIPDLESSKDPDHKIFMLGINDFINDTKRSPKEAMELLNLKEKT